MKDIVGRKQMDGDTWRELACSHYAKEPRGGKVGSATQARCFICEPKKGEKLDKLDGYFSVFNLHVNAAGARTKQKFIDTFGYEVWKSELEEAWVNGIMVIFQTKPTKYTQWFVDEVEKVVNEGRA